MKKKVRWIMMFTMVVCLCGVNACDMKSIFDKESLYGGPRELLQMAIRTAVEVAPKDLETPPEEGGYGFEKIADKLGFQTYTFTEDDKQFFGDPRAKKGGVLVTIVSRFPGTMRTVGKNSSYVENSELSGMLYEGMLNLHPVSLEYIPELASHWKISDDKLTFTFRLNPDARWSDGMPVTAEDVILTWDLLMDETILSPSDQLTYGKFERPVALGKYIVTVRCKELNWRNFLYFSASMHILPAHHLRGLSGTEYLQKYQFRVMPGTGPYTVLDHDIKNQLSYAVTRRIDYWAADNEYKKYQYNFDKIKNIVVRDNTTLEFEKFKKGEQDFYTVSMARRWIEECDFKAIQKGWIQKHKIYSEKPAGTSGYAFNMRVPPFNDRRIRYAFTYLLNREKMNSEMYYNEYLLQNSLYAGSIYENPNNEQITYNPEKAVALLAEAGWSKRDSDGWLVNDQGQRLSVELGIPKGIDYMVTPYQQMLKDYGIELQIKFVDSNALWKTVMERQFTITYSNYSGLVFPNPETSFNSELADKDYNNNVSGFKNERVDELSRQYDVEFSQKRRIEIIREIDGIVADERPTAWATYRSYQRLLFWNKFGYPEHMVSRYGGDYASIPVYWWFDIDKINTLWDAMKNDTSLPVGDVDVKFWPEYLQKEREREQKEQADSGTDGSLPSAHRSGRGGE